MELPITRCNYCGKALKLTESVVTKGKTFCSQACHSAFLQKQLNQ